MGSADSIVIEQIKEIGNRLLELPSSPPQLLKLLDELELLLSKIGQSPSQLVQEALLGSMKALIADELLKNSDADVKITVAACLNQIMRISAPVAPYDDAMMKEIFELIVSSFDNLSCPPGRCYSKAVLILESVARLRSCVMMLDLDIDALIVKMFELFQKTIRPDHPHSVFLAMVNIMSVVIKESDTVSMELLKALFASIRNANENNSPTSWKLGAKIIEECAEKLKPHIMTTVEAMGCCLEDYAPILSTISKNKPKTDDSSKHVQVNNEHKSHVVVYVQALKAIERCSQSDLKASGDRRSDSASTASKKGRKPNSCSPDDGTENQSGKGKTSLASPHGHLKKSSIITKDEEKTMPASEDASKFVTEEVNDLDHKELHHTTSLGDGSKKKGRLPKRDVSGGSGNKTGAGTFRKDKSHTNDASKPQKKRASVDDDVIETPHGRKNYKEDLVGCRIKVWWPLDRRYYEGSITSYDPSAKKHKVDYDDGDEEILNLRKERWEFLGEETADMDLLAHIQTQRPPSNVPQRVGSTETAKEASNKHSGEKSEGVVSDSGAKSDDGSNQAMKIEEKFETPEVAGETKKPRLSSEQKS